jgi:nitrogen fixation NifU-like protein
MNLYQEIILEHNKKPRNWGTLEGRTHYAEGINPLCGDHIFLDMIISSKIIEDVSFQGESCAICKSSASIMTTILKNNQVDASQKLFDQFRSFIKGDIHIDDPKMLNKFLVFSGIRDLPSRVKCAILPWHTFNAAINNNHSTSTE